MDNVSIKNWNCQIEDVKSFDAGHSLEMSLSDHLALQSLPDLQSGISRIPPEIEIL